jgi:rubrerythrin
MAIRLVKGIYVCEDCGWEGEAGMTYGVCPKCEPENHESFMDFVNG